MTVTDYRYAETTPEDTRAGDALFKRVPDEGWLELSPADLAEPGAILALLQSNLIVLAVRELPVGVAIFIRRS